MSLEIQQDSLQKLFLMTGTFYSVARRHGKDDVQSKVWHIKYRL